MLLGVHDKAAGETTLIGHSYYRGTLLVFVHALLNAIGCWIAGMIVGIIIGMGQSAVPPVIGLFTGLGVTWWMAWRFHQDYLAAKAA